MSIRFLWCLCCPRPLTEQEVLTQGLPGHTTVRRLEMEARSLEEEYDKNGEGSYSGPVQKITQHLHKKHRMTPAAAAKLAKKKRRAPVEAVRLNTPNAHTRSSGMRNLALTYPPKSATASPLPPILYVFLKMVEDADLRKVQQIQIEKTFKVEKTKGTRDVLLRQALEGGGETLRCVKHFNDDPQVLNNSKKEAKLQLLQGLVSRRRYSLCLGFLAARLMYW